MGKAFNIRAFLSLDTRKYDKNLKKSQKGSKTFADSVKKGFSAVKTGVLAAAAAIAAAGAALLKFVKLADQQIQAETKVATAVKSTGMAAGYTTKQLKDMASELQNITTYGDEDILANLTTPLLTFTNIADENFAKTQKAALDMATALGMDLKSAALQLGKALNDPISQLSSLSRSGVQFSDVQKDMIKQMAETGDIAGAQTIILEELNRQFGGQAEAAAKKGLGGWKQFSNTLGDIGEQIGFLVMPAFNKFVNYLKQSLPYMIRGINSMVNVVIDLYNEFVDVYNKSSLFRAIIVSTKGAFQVLWENAKFTLTSIGDALVLIKDVVIAAFSPDESISDAWTTFLDKMKENTKKYEQEIKGIVLNGVKEIVNGTAKAAKPFSGVMSAGSGIGAGENQDYVYNDTYDIYKITKQLNDEYNSLNEEIAESTKLLEKLNNGDFAKFKTSMDVVQTSISDVTDSIGNLLQVTSQLASEGAGFWLNYVASFAQGTGQIFTLVQDLQKANEAQVLSNSAASASNAAKDASSIPFGWIAIPAIIATILGMFAPLLSKAKGYATGGIVPGLSFSGDKVPAMVNSGEMILNQAQQAELFKLANGGAITGGEVEFKIKGTDLIGVLKNYDRKLTKTR